MPFKMDIECSICRDNFNSTENNGTVFATKCGHIFHHQCILQWMERSGTCPHCRSAIDRNLIFKLNVFFEDSEVLMSSKAKIDKLEKEIRTKIRKLHELREKEKTSRSKNRNGHVVEIIDLSDNSKDSYENIEVIDLINSPASTSARPQVTH